MPSASLLLPHVKHANQITSVRGTVFVHRFRLSILTFHFFVLHLSNFGPRPVNLTVAVPIHPSLPARSAAPLPPPPIPPAVALSPSPFSPVVIADSPSQSPLSGSPDLGCAAAGLALRPSPSDIAPAPVPTDAARARDVGAFQVSTQLRPPCRPGTVCSRSRARQSQIHRRRRGEPFVRYGSVVGPAGD